MRLQATMIQAIRPAAAAESRTPPRRALTPVALAVLTLAAGSALAQPATNQLPVRNGTAPINATVGATTGTPSNPVLPISQQASPTNRAVIEWSSFNVGSAARVDFQQPNAQSVLLNRVVGGSGNSQIYGALTANGNIFIVNPFGVYFGGSSQINVGSLIASSLDLTPAMADNNYQGFLTSAGVDLTGSGQYGVQTASDTPANKITAAQGGSVTLLGGGFVSAGGNIDAPGGRINLAVAPAMRVVPVGQSGFVDLVITTPGASGSATVGGVLNASSTVAGTRGGQINVQAPAITTYFGEPGNSVLAVDGPAGGGSITLGDTNTRAARVEPGSILSADATDAGNGGSVAVRALYDSVPPGTSGPIARSTFGVAEVYGTLQARGGPNAGNGGRIETSGTALATSLQAVGSPTVTAATLDARARAAGGQAGTWTLDPFDVTITNAASVAVNGIFQPTGPGANVRAADISAALDAGTSVEISTGTAAVGSAAGDITLGAQTAITRGAGTVPTTLTLRAHGNVTLVSGSSIGVASSAVGPLNVNLLSDLDGNGSGAVSMVSAAITTGGGNVVLGGGLDPATGYASASASAPGVLVQRSTIDTAGAASRGDVVVRGTAAGATASAASQTGVLIDISSVNAGNIAVTGQAGAGTAVGIVNSSLGSSAGLVQLRGVATRNVAGAGQALGVDLAGAAVDIGTGSLVVAGRADENNLAANAPATGVRANDLRVSGAATSTGQITLAGQSVGSAAPGITAPGSEASGVQLAIDNDGSLSPIGANVVLGASAGAQVLAALGLSPARLRVLTNGAVNLRPLGVDAAGNVVEQAAVPIAIGVQSITPAGSFVVDPALLLAPGAPVGQSGGLSPGRGFVIGSSVHTGLISLLPAALPAGANLSLNLQNQGAGSAGISLGGGNVLGTLALLSSGNVSQSGPVTAQNLVVQGGAASRVDLSNPGNQFGVLAFDPPQFLSVATQGNLTVDAAAALGCDAAAGAFTPLTITNSVAGAQTVLRSIGGDLRLNRSIALPTEGASTLDLVTPGNFVAGEGVAITGPAGSQWRVWAPAPANVTRGSLAAPNVYGCAFGDTATCSLSGVALPSGNRFLFADRPLLTVSANPASGVSGQGLPALTYGFTGVVNGDAPEGVLAGALGTAATANSPPGTYAINQGTLTSPLGYRLQYQGADLTLAAPPYDIRDPSRQALMAGFLFDQRSDVYGRNLSLPYICTAASAVARTASDGPTTDPLASEWGKVRGLPQLSGCLDVKDGGQCAAF
jgi:filamentous hemagglutinin family protein